jgi:tRNA-specific 2-thiouridylase
LAFVSRETPDTKPRDGLPKPKALIAMSGGVDSSVAVSLMLARGYDCIGVTMKLFDDAEWGGDAGSSHKEKSCCSLSDVNDARDVAYRCGIPHYTLNLKDQFKRDVIERFISVYEAGGTPNPCIDCNRFLKFNLLLLRARQLEFDYLVTGHYARIEKSGGRYLLKKALDDKKDQSYVLYAMNQDQLANTIFPIGELRKEDVRTLASESAFINAAKQDSQDICFVPDGDYGAFIEKYLGKKYPEGDIIDGAGKLMGRHKGYIRYTIGQRRGLGVAANEPLYVVAKSTGYNTVTLGPDSALYTNSLIANNINLIALDTLDKPLRVAVKTRYLQKEQNAVVEQISPSSFRVDFDSPQRAVTPGQACVLYDGDVVIGGGTIAGKG